MSLLPIVVEIVHTQGFLRVDAGSRLGDLVRWVLALEDRDQAAISIALVDNATIHSVNRLYLDHDWPTDVISFPFSDPDDSELAGELVVSAQMAVSSALERGINPLDELALYLIHGLLHLCGYDDKNEVDALRMRDREQRILADYRLTDPFPFVVRPPRTRRAEWSSRDGDAGGHGRGDGSTAPSRTSERHREDCA